MEVGEETAFWISSISGGHAEDIDICSQGVMFWVHMGIKGSANAAMLMNGPFLKRESLKVGTSTGWFGWLSAFQKSCRKTHRFSMVVCHPMGCYSTFFLGPEGLVKDLLVRASDWCVPTSVVVHRRKKRDDLRCKARRFETIARFFVLVSKLHFGGLEIGDFCCPSFPEHRVNHIQSHNLVL